MCAICEKGPDITFYKPDPDDDRRAGTILIVDDDSDILDLFAVILSKEGYTVATMQRSIKAVEFFQTHCDEIGLVILDFMMPDMNGVEVFEQLRRIDPVVKAMFCSAYDIKDAVLSLDSKHPVSFFQKPVTMSDLLSAVSRVLEKG